MIYAQIHMFPSLKPVYKQEKQVDMLLAFLAVTMCVPCDRIPGLATFPDATLSISLGESVPRMLSQH